MFPHVILSLEQNIQILTNMNSKSVTWSTLEIREGDMQHSKMEVLPAVCAECCWCMIETWQFIWNLECAWELIGMTVGDWCWFSVPAGLLIDLETATVFVHFFICLSAWPETKLTAWHPACVQPLSDACTQSLLAIQIVLAELSNFTSFLSLLFGITIVVVICYHFGKLLLIS